ncbi:26S proteasome non-ATPase regulatory subunit [Ceratobasidium theobromae]|uniref:protein S-acyltransferase n=1 Tax=Ceratobasidium theobromae TaxID=1582974 RepID=A0A5N5QKU7_9AGAM|nr:26S proteasome non-ATPase regulatory subunit [Ceratobasidium theobromae]
MVVGKLGFAGPAVEFGGHVDQASLVRSLLSADPQLLNAKDADERTALHWAASAGAIEIVQDLISHKSAIDPKDNSGWTPLMIAGNAGHGDIVQELLGAGANVNATNDKGLTPLHYAASKGRVDVGKLLITRGADINAKDRANQHPLWVLPQPIMFALTARNRHRAASAGHDAFLTILLNPPEGRPKTRLNTGDRLGNTPLHLAFDSAHAAAAAVLIEAGADRSRQNADGQTPEEVEGVGGQEQKRAREYVIQRCGSA